MGAARADRSVADGTKHTQRCPMPGFLLRSHRLVVSARPRMSDRL